MKPRLLYLTPFWPQRAGIGAELRSRCILQALQQVGSVDVAVVDDDRIADPQLSSDNPFKIAYRFDVAPRPTKGVFGKIRWLLDPTCSYPHGCGVDPNTAQHFRASLDRYDLIWFFKFRTPNLFPHAPWPRSVLDIDDVPSTFEQASLEHARSFRQRLVTHTRKFSWTRRERQLARRFTTLTVCSEGDRQYLAAMGVDAPIHVVPNGFDKPATEPVRQPANPPRIGFIGYFDYAPNRQAIDWFIQHCWPQVKRAVPNARLRLVGRGSDQIPIRPEDNIDSLGFVSNPSLEIATWSATVVPIRTGAGTRIKIAQAFGHKCPIISTSLGAYGYNPVNGREMYLADSADDFANACIKAIREPEQAAQMAERAWRFFLEKWTWDAIRPRIEAAAQDCLRLSSNTRLRPTTIEPAQAVAAR